MSARPNKSDENEHVCACVVVYSGEGQGVRRCSLFCVFGAYFSVEQSRLFQRDAFKHVREKEKTSGTTNCGKLF